MPKKVPEKVRKARLRRLVQLYREEREYLRILSVTGNEVVVRFAGYEIDFVYRNGQMTRGPGNHRYLSADDWAFLFTLAEELTQAAFNGYKKDSSKKAEQKQSENTQLSFRF